MTRLQNYWVLFSDVYMGTTPAKQDFPGSRDTPVLQSGRWLCTWWTNEWSLLQYLGREWTHFETGGVGKKGRKEKMAETQEHRALADPSRRQTS